MKKTAMIAALALAACASLSAQERWYVCLGSFKKQDNADNYAKYLETRNVSVRIVDARLADGRLMHRVLQSRAYDSYADAYDRRSKLQKEDFILRLGIRDLWVCKDASFPRAQERPNADPVDTDVSHTLHLEPAAPRGAAFRTAPAWEDGALDETQEFRMNGDGDFEIVSNSGFDSVTVTRYEFRR